MGVVSPVSEQGAVIAKTALLKAQDSLRQRRARLAASARVGTGGGEPRRRKVRSGWEDLVVAGGVEHVRVPLGSDGGAWAQDRKPTRRPASCRRASAPT